MLTIRARNDGTSMTSNTNTSPEDRITSTMTSNNTSTAPEDRITSSCWVPEGFVAKKSANPRVFEEGSSDNVPLPSMDPALHLSGLSSRSSTLDAFRLGSLDSTRIGSVDSQRVGSSFDWLQHVLTSASARATANPSERMSTVDLLTKTVLGEDEPTLSPEHEAEEEKKPSAVKSPPTVPAKPAKTSSTRSKSTGRVYVTEVLQWDILSERGGKANHHDGNKRYRKVVTEMKSQYRGIATKQDKTQLSRTIVAYVSNYGGRFLKKDKNGRYFEMTPAEARKKTSQALRETKQLKWTQVDVQDKVEV